MSCRCVRGKAQVGPSLLARLLSPSGQTFTAAAVLLRFAVIFCVLHLAKRLDFNLGISG